MAVKIKIGQNGGIYYGMKNNYYGMKIRFWAENDLLWHEK